MREKRKIASEYMAFVAGKPLCCVDICLVAQAFCRSLSVLLSITLHELNTSEYGFRIQSCCQFSGKIQCMLQPGIFEASTPPSSAMSMEHFSWSKACMLTLKCPQTAFSGVWLPLPDQPPPPPASLAAPPRPTPTSRRDPWKMP